MSTPLLEFVGISKVYRRHAQKIVALDNFSFRIDKGEVVGLLGPNGSGKTTAVKVATSLCEPNGGKLLYRGVQPSGKGHLRELGVLLEGRGALNERLSTWENARYFCGLREAAFDPAHFHALAGLLDISDSRAPVRLLSSGHRLRSSLLVCLIHRPQLVFLDEPTIGLDLFGVGRLEALVGHCSSLGTSFVLSSHDFFFIERLCERIVCLRQGRKVFDGGRADFLHVDHEYVLRLVPGSNGPPTLPAGLVWGMSGSDCVLPVRDHRELCAVLDAIVPDLSEARGLRIEQVALRDKYLALMSNAGTSDETIASPPR